MNLVIKVMHVNVVKKSLNLNNPNLDMKNHVK